MTKAWLLAMVIVLQVGVTASEEEDRFPSHVFFPPGLAQMYLRQAIEGAMDRLEDPVCLQVLTDFTDDAGNLLSANLADLQFAAGQRLSELVFVDATDQPDCLDPSTGAYTTPRSRVVFVCGARFTSGPYSLAGAAGEILIIHELLHSLGLPENPSTNDAPTSAQITRRVWARCGDARSLAARNRQNWTANRDDETKPSSRIAARPGFLR